MGWGWRSRRKVGESTERGTTTRVLGKKEIQSEKEIGRVMGVERRKKERERL